MRVTLRPNLGLPILGILAMATSMAFFSCGEKEASTTGAPPLFNAIDPSIECPADQVGWDFSTGGLQDINRNLVGREITITEANFGGNCTSTLEASFRAACDSQEKCSLPIDCDNGDFTLKYQCGTERSTYQAFTETAEDGTQQVTLICGVPITIAKAIYAPDSGTPVDITSALAANCSGKRRCANGLTASALNANQDPNPGQADTVEIHYVCGGEATETVRTVDENSVDLYCATEERSLSFNENLRILSVSSRLPPREVSWLPNLLEDEAAYVDRQRETIREACEGRVSCTFGVELPSANFKDYVLRPEGEDMAGVPHRVSPNLLFVEYACGAETAPSVRTMLPASDATGGSEFTLSCGQPMTILEAYVDNTVVRASEKTQLTNEMKEACDGKRVCYAPVKHGSTGRIEDPRSRLTPDNGYIKYRVNCGDLLNVTDFIIEARYGTINQAHLQCPTFDPEVFKGIRIATVTPSDQTIAITKRCFGRDKCDTGGAEVSYRCGTSPRLDTGSGEISCEPSITLLGISGCDTREPPSDPHWCQRRNQLGTCSYSHYPRTDYRWNCDEFTVHYTCGADPSEQTVTQTTSNPGEPWVPEAEVHCPTRINPFVRKECIPKICYGQTRRDEDLQCVADSTLQPSVDAQFPFVNDWEVLADGSTSRYGGPSVAKVDGLPTLKSNFPYQAFSFIYYRPDNGQPLPDNTHVTIYAFDVFEKKSDATHVMPGFRCIVGDAPLKDSAMPTRYSSFQAALVGGKRAVIPSMCFDQEAFNDETTAWYDAAKRAQMSESNFREEYQRQGTWLVSSFDPSGKNSVRRYSRVAVAPDPIGFYYDPLRDWVDKLNFYGARANYNNKMEVRFESSKEIEISAVDQTVSAADLWVDVEKPELLPGLEVDFSWYLRGDSPSNPYSPLSRVQNNPAGVSLKDRNLTATVEIARQDPSLQNPWIANNAVRFAPVPISGTDPFGKADRVNVKFTSEVRKRMLSIRGNVPGGTPNGFMSDALDEDTIFLVRTCLDMNGMQRRPGDTDIDDKSLQQLSGYGLKVNKRCGPTGTIVVRRQLYVRPLLPAEAKEASNEKGAMAGSGDGDVGGGNDNGSQNNCSKKCTVNADCGSGGVCEAGGICQRTPSNDSCTSKSRSQMGLSGQFPLTLFSTRSDSATTQNSAQSTTNSTTGASAEMLGFTTFMPQSSSGSAGNASSYSFEINIAPNLQPIIDVWKGKKVGVISTDAKKVLMKRKAVGTGSSAATAERDGLGFAIGKEFFLTIGPVPLVLELGFSAGLGFGVTLKISGENASAGQTSAFYPCLNDSGSKCYFLETEAKTFGEASEVCKAKGGQLAPVVAGALSAVNAAIDAGGAAADEVWVGGQAAYLYSYPPCETNGYVGPKGETGYCQQNSSTGYFWLAGGSRFAAQNGQSSSFTPYASAHGFSDLDFTASPIPQKAGVVYRKSDSRVVALTTSNVRKFVCRYDPASSVVTKSISITFGVEISAGASAAICLPSNKAGVCVGLSLKFVSIGLAFEGGTANTAVYGGTTPRLKSMLGSSYNKASWTVAFLQGAIDLQFRFLFWTKSVTLKQFSWGPSITNDLYNFPTSYYKEY